MSSILSGAGASPSEGTANGIKAVHDDVNPPGGDCSFQDCKLRLV